MLTPTRAAKPRKIVHPDILSRRVERAVRTLKKSVMVALRQKLIAMSQWSAINNQLNALDSALTAAFRRPIEADESAAKLPF